MGSDRVLFYRTFKVFHGIENYLYFLEKRIFRDAYIRFRMGVSELYGHGFRYEKSNVVHLCPLCKEEEECESHFLLYCPALCDIRERYIFVFLDVNQDDPMKVIMSDNEMKNVRALSLFLHKAFERRRDALDSAEC